MGEKIKALTFALPIKKGVKSKAKRSLKVWKQQQIIFGFIQGNVSANINLEFDVIISRENTTVSSNNSFTMESLILAQDER